MALEQYKNNRVLVVDDQAEIHNDFIEMLTPNPRDQSTDAFAATFVEEVDTFDFPQFEISHATGGREACLIVQEAKDSGYPIALAFVDIRMPPGIDGVETIRRVRRIDRDIEIVIMTAYADRPLSDIIQDMELLHKLLYIRKPFAWEEIQQITLSLVGKWNIEQDLNNKRRQLAESHQRLEAVLDAAGDAMVMFDPDGRVVFANRGYQQLVDLRQNEMKAISPVELSARFEERFREPGLPEVEGKFVFMSGENLVEEIASDQLPGKRLFYRSDAPVHDDRQGEIGRLMVLRDVSSEIEVERMRAEVLRLRTELETTYSFAGMVGASSQMRRVYELIQQVADSDITVLIRGESGTGKEMVAKSFHFNSVRRKRPFVTVNCAALPETLIESELFGHEKGAFTGADNRRTGAFERADGGTIFLDEVGEMNPSAQAKLLRVLQEREIQPVGASATRSINVRVIAATNTNLEDALQSGSFRQDLYYRLAVFPIEIPPLRERREDIPVLANHFLKKYAERADRSIGGLSNAAVRTLLQYAWPGNVRELENAIERAVLLETTAVLQVNNLPPELLPLSDPEDALDSAGILPLETVERQALVHALKASRNNVARAARGLGINRATLYRKLKKYGLRSEQ